MRKYLKIFVVSAMLATTAMASETVIYTYDAHGRLVKVERAGTVNNNVVAEYVHDMADNRTSTKVTGSP